MHVRVSRMCVYTMLIFNVVSQEVSSRAYSGHTTGDLGINKK